MGFLTAYCTDKGIKKSTNQDGLLIKTATSSIGDIALVVVCDGMGGLDKGEVASGYVIRRLSAWFEEELPYLFGTNDVTSQICGSLKWLVEDCNQKLQNHGREFGCQLGTTLTGMLIVGQQYYVVHVGDTRLYEINQTIRQLTEDQTVVNNEIKLGKLTPEQAEHDPRRSVLLQCIGASNQVVPDFMQGMVDAGAVYMICCDGFRHVISDMEFADGFHPQKMVDESVMFQQCQNFVETVKQRGEKDNITTVLLRVV